MSRDLRKCLRARTVGTRCHSPLINLTQLLSVNRFAVSVNITVRMVFSQHNPLNLSGRIRPSKRSPPAIRALVRLVVSIALCVTLTQRLSSLTTVNITTVNLHRPTSNITRKPLTWRKRPRSSTLTRWTLRQHTSRNIAETRASLYPRKHKRSSAPTNPFSKQAHIMRRSRTGRTARTIFSMRSTHSSLTTRFPSTEDQHTKTISQSVRQKS